MRIDTASVINISYTSEAELPPLARQVVAHHLSEQGPGGEGEVSDEEVRECFHVDPPKRVPIGRQDGHRGLSAVPLAPAQAPCSLTRPTTASTPSSRSPDTP